MTIDATFWVAISFFIFFVGLIYLKVPQKINSTLDEKIKHIKNELDEAEKLKNESKNLLSSYENKIDDSKKETKEIINLSKKQSEAIMIEKTNKFHQDMDLKKKNAEQKISQLKEDALHDIRKTSVKISIEAVTNLIKNSVDKNKLENVYIKGLDEIKTALKKTKI
jgi:F-type H+-transporting ATPase subunit b